MNLRKNLQFVTNGMWKRLSRVMFSLLAHTAETSPERQKWVQLSIAMEERKNVYDRTRVRGDRAVSMPFQACRMPTDSGDQLLITERKGHTIEAF
jgi:hypothetical protein